jgi:hypothetical protein
MRIYINSYINIKKIPNSWDFKKAFVMVFYFIFRNTRYAPIRNIDTMNRLYRSRVVNIYTPTSEMTNKIIKYTTRRDRRIWICFKISTV